MIDELPDVKRMHEELIGLRAAFLTNTTKLGAICSAFQVDPHQELPDFELDVKRKATLVLDLSKRVIEMGKLILPPNDLPHA